MQGKEFRELAAMVAQFDPEAFGSIDPQDFVGFGMKDSHVYRAMFMRLTANLSATDRTWVVILATAIKSRERILTALNTSFVAAPWRNAVIQFSTNHTATKNSDITGGRDLMPVINIPGCVPPIAALAWKNMTRTTERTYERFVENQWVAQLYVSDEVLADQKIWETDLWENRIVTGGRTFTPGFKEGFWNTKSKDNYPLINEDMNVYLPDKMAPYTKAEIMAWLAQPGEA